ncbi:iron-sulfur cluster-binding domain-containing protein [Actinomycetospora sp. NBRC 106378]|uniref:iron-sulfur cluster-binding domain-containing protein n=1 Tax=Actinomycetospora sp. NBRC 106378 TaxID=3032208 RepID=UPI0024A4BCB6|nr:iron-sulfur cluster-binding domain-containing protein [Actinomycetospora sp. NBRC 106378]GLZ52606.1 ferredoxin [Actinomycetospora sp. NBRC 106378]
MILQVTAVRTPSPGLRALTLVGDDLPSYPPGAHLPVEWAPGRVNPYSLTGLGIAPETYEITVARRSGGSARLHGLEVGDPVHARSPRSGFPPVETAAHHVLVAGGVGVTPLLGHARWHAFWGHSFEVLAVGAPHLGTLRELGPLTVARDRRELADLLRPVVGNAPWNSHVYTCGPPGLIAAVAAAARAAHWVDARIHAEPFVHEPAGAPFEVLLRRSRRRVRVAADESLLDAVDRIGLPAPRLCRQGVCGECLTTLLAGTAEHHDHVDAAEHGRIAPCVSRAAPGETLELDL